MPRLSVLIPIYNPGPKLELCLASVKRQTYPELEVLPIDDAGEEVVRPHIERYAHADARWKPLYHSTNLGLAASLNDGVNRSTGGYILILQQDCELIHSDAFERAVPIALANKRWCLSGDWVLPRDDLTVAEQAFAVIWNHLPSPEGADFLPKAFSELKSDLFPRSALREAGGFDERLRVSGEDQLLSFRLHALGYQMRTCSALAIALRSGRQTTVRANLRKEFLYGRSQAFVLSLSGRRLINMNRRFDHGRRKLRNRVLGFLSGLSLATLIASGLTTGISLFSLAFLMIPIIRLGVVSRRVWRNRAALSKPLQIGALVLVLTPVDDAIYAFGLLAGSFRCVTLSTSRESS